MLAVAETKAMGGSVRRTQNSWGRFCGGWKASVHCGGAGVRRGALVGFGMVFGVVLGLVLVGMVLWFRLRLYFVWFCFIKLNGVLLKRSQTLHLSPVLTILLSFCPMFA